MPFKPQFKGVSLLAHGLDSGMSDWGIARWKQEIADIKAMGADTMWYAPIQFGRRNEDDLAERSRAGVRADSTAVPRRGKSGGGRDALFRRDSRRR